MIWKVIVYYITWSVCFSLSLSLSLYIYSLCGRHNMSVFHLYQLLLMAVTNFHKLDGLKQPECIQFWRPEVQSEYHQSDIRVGRVTLPLQALEGSVSLASSSLNLFKASVFYFLSALSSHRILLCICQCVCAHTHSCLISLCLLFQGYV